MDKSRPSTPVPRRGTTLGLTQARSYYFQIEKEDKEEIEPSEIFFGYFDNDEEIDEGCLGPFLFDGFLDEAPFDKGT